MTETTPRPTFILEQARNPFRPVWARIGEYDTFEAALKWVRGDANHQIVNNVTGETHMARSRYGGGLEVSGDFGKTWRRIARPGASKVIGLGLPRKALEKGFAANPAARNQDMTTPSTDAITEMARRGAAINAGGER